MTDQGDWRFHVIRAMGDAPKAHEGDKPVSESLIVEVRRLREAQERIAERLASLVEVAGAIPLGDEVDDLLTQLEGEIDQLVQNQER